MSFYTQQEIATPTKKPQLRNYFSTKRITYIATLTAITLIFKYIGNVLSIGDSFKLSLTYTGWILSAIILGPLGAAAVGFTTDILGTFMSGYSINPILTAAYTFIPLIIGICYKYIPLKNDTLKLIIGTTLAALVGTIFIASYGLYFVMGYYKAYTFWQYVITFRLAQLLIVGTNLVICIFLLPVAKSIKADFIKS